MEIEEDIYINLPEGESHLLDEVEKLQQQNNVLQELINSLETDIEKLCTKITDMKKIQDNLTKNISELYKTAKAELERKDRTIAELRNKLDQYLFRKRSVPLKRERESSPNLGRYDSATKRIRNEENRSRSSERRPHRDRSSDRSRRDSKNDRYKYDCDFRRNLIRDDKYENRHYKTNSRREYNNRENYRHSTEVKNIEIERQNCINESKEIANVENFTNNNETETHAKRSKRDENLKNVLSDADNKKKNTNIEAVTEKLKKRLHDETSATSLKLSDIKEFMNQPEETDNEANKEIKEIVNNSLFVVTNNVIKEIIDIQNFSSVSTIDEQENNAQVEESSNTTSEERVKEQQITKIKTEENSKTRKEDPEEKEQNMAPPTEENEPFDNSFDVEDTINDLVTQINHFKEEHGHQKKTEEKTCNLLLVATVERNDKIDETSKNEHIEETTITKDEKQKTLQSYKKSAKISNISKIKSKGEEKDKTFSRYRHNDNKSIKEKQKLTPNEEIDKEGNKDQLHKYCSREENSKKDMITARNQQDKNVMKHNEEKTILIQNEETSVKLPSSDNIEIKIKDKLHDSHLRENVKHNKEENILNNSEKVKIKISTRKQDSPVEEKTVLTENEEISVELPSSDNKQINDKDKLHKPPREEIVLKNSKKDMTTQKQDCLSENVKHNEETNISNKGMPVKLPSSGKKAVENKDKSSLKDLKNNQKVETKNVVTLKQNFPIGNTKNNEDTNILTRNEEMSVKPSLGDNKGEDMKHNMEENDEKVENKDVITHIEFPVEKAKHNKETKILTQHEAISVKTSNDKEKMENKEKLHKCSSMEDLKKNEKAKNKDMTTHKQDPLPGNANHNEQKSIDNKEIENKGKLHKSSSMEDMKHKKGEYKKIENKDKTSTENIKHNEEKNILTSSKNGNNENEKTVDEDEERSNRIKEKFAKLSSKHNKKPENKISKQKEDNFIVDKKINKKRRILDENIVKVQLDKLSSKKCKKLENKTTSRNNDYHTEKVKKSSDTVLNKSEEKVDKLSSKKNKRSNDCHTDKTNKCSDDILNKSEGRVVTVRVEKLPLTDCKRDQNNEIDKPDVTLDETPPINTKKENKSDTKSKKLKDIKHDDVATSLIEESDRVLRSATRRNYSKEVEKEKKEESDKKLEPLQIPSDDFITVNLSHDGEIPVLHICEDSNSINSPFSNFANCTSSPVTANVEKSSNSSFDLSYVNSSNSLNNSTSTQKILNTSSGRKRRRVVMTMID